MKQIGTPINTPTTGVALTAGFASLTAGLFYIAYTEGDVQAALSGVCALAITGLTGFNTYVLCMGDDAHISEADIIG